MTPPADDWSSWKQQVDLDAYDERWRALEESGHNPHGEVDFVLRFRPASVLDAGCGTGRVAIELARRGVEVTGVDLDEDMLAKARIKAPELVWVSSNLATLDLDRRFDVVIMAGNVIPFAAVDQRADVVEACARHVGSDGRLLAGFSLRAGWPSLDEYDAWCEDAGLELAERFATWDGAPFAPPGDYAVSVHRPVGGQR